MMSTETTAPDKGRYHHGDLPNALLDAAESIVAADGVSALSLRAAARQVGVSHAAPAHHFGDLHGLLVALARRGHGRFHAALVAARDEVHDAPLDARLGAAGRAYFRFAVENPGVFSIMFSCGDEVFESETEPVPDAFSVLRVLVAEGLGGVDPEDRVVGRLAMSTWATIHGSVVLWLQGAPRTMLEVEIDEYYPPILDSALRALQSDPMWKK